MENSVEVIRQFCDRYGKTDGSYAIGGISDASEHKNAEKMARTVKDHIDWLKAAAALRDDIKRRMEHITEKEEVANILRDLPIVCGNICSLFLLLATEDDTLKIAIIMRLTHERLEDEQRIYLGVNSMPVGASLERVIESFKRNAGWNNLDRSERKRASAAFEEEIARSSEKQIMLDDMREKILGIAKDITYIEQRMTGQLREIERRESSKDLKRHA